MSYSTYGFASTKSKTRNKQFLVAKEYRTNRLSHIDGGGIVKVIQSDGSERVYNNIKDTDAYTYSVERYQPGAEAIVLVSSSY
jgi:AICAR transformylase/IMP cyclohydrolase PurH